MILPDHIQDIHTAGQEWLKRKVTQDEVVLKDYERPLCKDTLKKPLKSSIPWFKYMLP